MEYAGRSFRDGGTPPLVRELGQGFTSPEAMAKWYGGAIDDIGVVAGLLLIWGVAAGVWIGVLLRRMAAGREALRAETAEREVAEHERVIAQERARIARDIHDDLGGALTTIALLSDAAIEQGAEGGSLEAIGSRTREAIVALDEIVWAVDPGSDRLDRLADCLCSLAEGVFDGTGIRCLRDVPMHLPGWPIRADVRHNIAMAVKEALVNALRLGLTWEAPRLRIEVEDDGVGLEAGETGRVRHGLTNQQDRMAQVAGRVEIAPRAGGGTRVKFEVCLDGIEAGPAAHDGGREIYGQSG